MFTDCLESMPKHEAHVVTHCQPKCSRHVSRNRTRDIDSRRTTAGMWRVSGKRHVLKSDRSRKRPRREIVLSTWLHVSVAF
ncbi:hypothetical protein MRX96_019585 [Rhipicephalus microplus]